MIYHLTKVFLLSSTTAPALLKEIGTMDDEEGRKIMYEKKKYYQKR